MSAGAMRMLRNKEKKEKEIVLIWSTVRVEQGD
jgi:hypothetical protein